MHYFFSWNTFFKTTVFCVTVTTADSISIYDLVHKWILHNVSAYETSEFSDFSSSSVYLCFSSVLFLSVFLKWDSYLTEFSTHLWIYRSDWDMILLCWNRTSYKRCISFKQFIFLSFSQYLLHTSIVRIFIILYFKFVLIKSMYLRLNFSFPAFRYKFSC